MRLDVTSDVFLVQLLAVTNLMTLIALVFMMARAGFFKFLKVEGGQTGSAGAFSSLPQPLVAALEQVGRKVQLAPNDVLFREGDAGDCLFVILAGRINIVKEIGGKIELLESFKPGEMVGEGAFLSGNTRAAGGVAKEKSTLLRVDREALESLPQSKLVTETIWRTFSWHKFDSMIRTDPVLRKKYSAKVRQWWFAHGVMKTLQMKADLEIPPNFSHVFLVSGKAKIGGIEFNGPVLVPLSTGRVVYAERVVHMVVLPSGDGRQSTAA